VTNSSPQLNLAILTSPTLKNLRNLVTTLATS
jgi:hypothetical protein